MSEKTELIWVDKNLAKKYNSLKDTTAQYDLIEKIIEKRKIDISCSIEALDEDVLRFKAVSVKHKIELQKALDDQLGKIEKLYDSIWEKEKQIKEKISKVEDLFEPINSKINEIQNKISHISIHNITELVSLIESLKYTDKKTQNILTFLMKNYKEEN